VPVPDARLDALAAMYSPKKVTRATAEFCDCPGLPAAREADALLHVLRCFGDSPRPLDDRETLDMELCMADIDAADKRLARSLKALKGDKSLTKEVEALQALRAHLDAGAPARSFAGAEALPADLPLLTAKPVLYCCNFSEELFAMREEYAPLRALKGEGVFAVCAEIEQEISRLDPADRGEFLADIGMTEPGADRLIALCYELMGLMSFLTAGPPEVRAWTIKKGTRAQDAAGKIHNDLKRGFIRADVVAFADLVACGSMAAAKEKGLTRSEGKDYIVRDGDVLLIKFNV
jgi:GTP-binding protein YchF